MILVVDNNDRRKNSVAGNDGNAAITRDGRATESEGGVSVSTVINRMKGYVTKQIGRSIWQKLFYDRVVRNRYDYARIFNYIDGNCSNV